MEEAEEEMEEERSEEDERWAGEKDSSLLGSAGASQDSSKSER